MYAIACARGVRERSKSTLKGLIGVVPRNPSILWVDVPRIDISLSLRDEALLFVLPQGSVSVTAHAIVIHNTFRLRIFMNTRSIHS